MTTHVAGTEPYAWPYDACIDPDRLALVLAGWDGGWAARSMGVPVAADRCGALASAVAALGGLVVAVAHDGSAVLPTFGVDHEAVASPGVDGFFASALDPVLRRQGRTHLLVAGHGLEGPVHSTLRSANDRGYECLLVTDACSSLTDDLVEAAAKTVTMSGGIFGALGTTGAVLSALADLPDRSTPFIAQEA